ncbi:hypothetical protein [Terriglobus saanensis]|uniref:Uncharacterized protein n=1 Tax=Terriglobus saanensis (strain ATCC BAA-1853 / DSM 23119 / SP1PR4) TaxID=401053 RepID=E8V0Z7_TERSS|nr:hypothetical protein [Terriglobus saanensis]ADV82288.1 hypothetical protein AciPR4_1465 [Terriglobus saanensis SP1PR4]
MDLSYQEKRIWMNLVAEVVVYAYYFGRVRLSALTVGEMVGLVVTMVVLQVTLQTTLALTAKREAMDERDRAIEGVAFRNAYFVLVIGLVAMIAMMWSLNSSGVPNGGFLMAHQSGFFAVNLVLVALFAAEVGKLVTQLVLYRRSA